MEQFITLAMYCYLTGIVITAIGIIVGYWIKEISGIKKSLDKHKADDKTEFYQSQEKNHTSHYELRQEIGRVKGGAELSIQELKGDLKSMNGKLDNLLEMLRNIISQNIQK